MEGFPGGSAGKESACNAGDLGWIPGLGRSPGERNGYSLQYSGFPESLVHKESTCSAENPGSISVLGRSTGGRDRLPSPGFLGFPCGSAGKEFTCNVEDLGSIPGLVRSPGEGKGYPLKYSGLENSMDCAWGHKESDTTEQHSLSLHLGRKAMTNLDSVLKSRDTTLPTKVCIVKVMYECESWTIKKAEHAKEQMLFNCGA